MRVRLIPRSTNLGNALVATGLLALVVSFWLPYGTATRVARVERRADEIARIVLEAALTESPIDLDSADDARRLLAEVRRRCELARHPPSARVEAIAAPDGRTAGLYMRGKHYLYLLTRARPRGEAAGDDAPRPPRLEVYAWPRSRTSPGHTAFYVPEDNALGRPAYTRNLHRGYVGLDVVPRAAAGAPREGETAKPAIARDRWYRGNDDERWILRPFFAGVGR